MWITRSSGATLLRMQEILEQSGVERKFISERLDEYQKQAERIGRASLSDQELARVAEHSARALRCNITYYRIPENQLLGLRKILILLKVNFRKARKEGFNCQSRVAEDGCSLTDRLV